MNNVLFYNVASNMKWQKYIHTLCFQKIVTLIINTSIEILVGITKLCEYDSKREKKKYIDKNKKKQ